jgi:hypothetical protein
MLGPVNKERMSNILGHKFRTETLQSEQADRKWTSHYKIDIEFFFKCTEQGPRFVGIQIIQRNKKKGAKNVII